MATPSAAALEHFQERQLQAAGYGDARLQAVRFRLMSPADAAAGRRYPLVIYLHGAGERGDDNRSHLLYLPNVLATPENRKRYPCYALALQCPANEFWVPITWNDPDAVPSKELSPPLAALRAVIESVTTTELVDPARIYLTGISMGGFGAWALAAAWPERFAALAPICGGGDPAWSAKLKELPIWAVHGEQDEVVPAGHSRRMIEAIRAAGGSPKYTELAGVGHHSWTPAYEPEFGLLDWMFAQRKS